MCFVTYDEVERCAQGHEAMYGGVRRHDNRVSMGGEPLGKRTRVKGRWRYRSLYRAPATAYEHALVNEWACEATRVGSFADDRGGELVDQVAQTR